MTGVLQILKIAMLMSMTATSMKIFNIRERTTKKDRAKVGNFLRHLGWNFCLSLAAIYISQILLCVQNLQEAVEEGEGKHMHLVKMKTKRRRLQRMRTKIQAIKVRILCWS